MRIQQIRSATLKVVCGTQTVLVDPWLQDKGRGFTAHAVRPDMVGVNNPLCSLPMAAEEVVDGVDFCLVTHVHPDHFTPDYLPTGIPIIAQDRDDASSIAGMGFSGVSCFDGPEMSIGDMTVVRVPAVHGDNAEVVKWMGKASGYVLEGAGHVLYIAGDTVYCEEVERTIERYRPDAICVNCCEATLPMGRLIMDLADVQRVCRKAPWATVVATHLDSVNHALLSSEDVRAYVAEQGLEQVKVPRNGEWLEV